MPLMAKQINTNVFLYLNALVWKSNMVSIEPMVDQCSGLLNGLPMDELGQVLHLNHLECMAWSLVDPMLDLLSIDIGHQCPFGPHGPFWIGSRHWVP